MKLVIVNYGAGNIQSIKFAFKRLGYEAVLSDNAKEIRAADRIIFPGVGEASSAMNKLRASGLDKVIPELEQPVLGLGIFNTDVVRFTNRVKVPQIGWNQITNLKSSLFKGVAEKDHIYLVHSYYAPICPETIAVSEYEMAYSSALQKDNFYGVQFHPEKSSKVGERILKNFLELS